MANEKIVSFEKSVHMGTMFVPESKFVVERAENEKGTKVPVRDENGDAKLICTKERPAMTAVRDAEGNMVRGEDGKVKMTERVDKDGKTVMIKPRVMIRLDASPERSITAFVPAGQVKPLTKAQEEWLQNQAKNEGHSYKKSLCVVLPSNRDSYDVVVQSLNEDGKTYTCEAYTMTRDQLRAAVRPENQQINMKPTGREAWQLDPESKGNGKGLAADQELSNELVNDFVGRDKGKGQTQGL